MGRLRLVLRLLGIQRTLIRHGLEEIVWATHLFRPIGWLRRLIQRRSSRESLGRRIRQTLEELGPIFVKFGQAVSTRRDLLPADIIDELAKLQDHKVMPSICVILDDMLDDKRLMTTNGSESKLLSQLYIRGLSLIHI